MSIIFFLFGLRFGLLEKSNQTCIHESISGYISQGFQIGKVSGFLPRGFKLEMFPGYIPRDFKFIFRDFKLERFGGGRAAQKNMSNKSNMKVIVRMIIYQFHCLVFCMTLE